ncbi:MAG: 50S ribosomal protein L6 [Gammaproteobacteria bacterium RIFCSPHIGHO2_12_FULL_42_10]|nr:MAG: 50S ribosomal protein L6 [Gammaproteobacteria bacterium RIFCSPHIGHO2_12_FULL_42_10]
MTTSRIGRKPVAIPKGTEVNIQKDKISAKGPRGHSEMSLHPFTHVMIEDNHVVIRLHDGAVQDITGPDMKLYRSITGTMRAKIHNMIHGVAHGFERKLLLVGVGYRAQAKGQLLVLSLGFSHPTEYHLPQGITIETPVPTEIIVKGKDKELVGQVASDIRNYRPPEPYKGKGVRYAEEVIELKETKKK